MYKQLLFFLLISCLVSAWPTPYTQPTCLGAYSVNGFNFTDFKLGSTTLSCTSGNFYFSQNGEYLNLLNAANRFYFLNSTRIRANVSGGTAINWFTHAPSDSQNYSINISGGSNGCIISNETSGAAANTIYINNQANCTMNYSSALGDYNITCLNSGTIAQTNITTPAGGPLYFSCNGYFDFPLFNDTLTKTLGNQSSWNSTPSSSFPQVYASYCNTSSAPSILYADILYSNATIPNSGIRCSNTSPYFKTLIVYGTTTILPKITFFPASGTYPIEAYPYYYDATSALSYLRNNSVAYILDQNNIWYTVPAVDVVDTSIIYTVSAFLASTGVSTAGTSIPIIPSLISCTESNNIYNITTNYSVAVTHLLYYYNATTINSSSVSSTNFSFLINTSIYPTINYSVNGNVLCRRQTSTSILGIASLGAINMGGASFIPKLLFVAITAIGLFNPFAMVFAVIFNDLFGVIALSDMVIVIIIGVLSSVVMSAYDRSSIKAIVSYTMLGAAVIVRIFSKIGIDYSGISNLTNGLSSFATCSSTTSAAACFDLLQFVQGTFGFMLALGVLLLTLPFVITNTITNLTCTYAAPMCVGGLFGSVMTAIGVLAYFAIGLIFYQIIRNSFISP